MPATLLSMSKKVAQDAGYSGTIASVTVVTGDAARIVQYVKDATAYIEAKWGDWRFLWGGLSAGTLMAGDLAIPAPVGHYRWDQDRLFFDNHLVTPITWDKFVPFAEMLTPGYPTQFVIMPDSSINMYPPADKEYSYSFSWYREPNELEADADEPLTPNRFRNAISSYALWLYAMYDDAAELAVKANSEYEKWMVLLEADQRPDGFPSNQSSGNHIVISAE